MKLRLIVNVAVQACNFSRLLVYDDDENYEYDDLADTHLQDCSLNSDDDYYNDDYDNDKYGDADVDGVDCDGPTKLGMV